MANPPQNAIIGGLPTVDVDVPITAVFLALYILGAVANMAIFQMNRKRHYKFLVSWALFGFCMARTATCVMRIVWATRLGNSGISLAAQILNNAGILVVYCVDLIFAQRILRCMHPKIGWHSLLSNAFRALYVLVAAALVMSIATTVISSETTDMHTKSVCISCLKAALIILFVTTTLPLGFLLLAFLMPRSRTTEESFGSGTVETKALILSLSTLLTIVIAGFKLGTEFESPRPISDPAWYDSRAAYYSFGFSLEILILCIFQISRVDKRFYVPDGSSRAKTYQIREHSEKKSEPE